MVIHLHFIRLDTMLSLLVFLNVGYSPISPIKEVEKDQLPVVKISKTPSPSRERFIPIILESGEQVPVKDTRISSDNIIHKDTTDNHIVPDSNPAPPFIIPTIKINDFFQAEGELFFNGHKLLICY